MQAKGKTAPLRIRVNRDFIVPRGGVVNVPRLVAEGLRELSLAIRAAYREKLRLNCCRRLNERVCAFPFAETRIRRFALFRSGPSVFTEGDKCTFVQWNVRARRSLKGVYRVARDENFEWQLYR